MSKLVWDGSGKRIYETGVSQGVLYPRSAQGTYPKGVAWNGLVSIAESPSGGEPEPLYADNTKYVNLMGSEEVGGTIEAYTYPDEFAICDGTGKMSEGVLLTQQPRSPFGLVYKTIIGNDTLGEAYGYKLHIVYNATASPSEKSYSTVTESPEAITFSWEFTTTPEPVTGFRPTSMIVIDSTKCDAAALAALEKQLFGADAVVDPPSPEVIANLPLPDAINALFPPVG